MEGVFLEISSLVSETVADSLELVVVILKALGIVVILYIVYFIIRTIFDIKRNRRIKSIESKVNLIEEKLDLLLKGQRKSSKKKRPKKPSK